MFDASNLLHLYWLVGRFFLAEPGVFPVFYRIPIAVWTCRAQSPANGVDVTPNRSANQSIRFWKCGDGKCWRHAAIKLSCKSRLLHFCWLVGRIPLGPDWIFLLPVSFSDARGPDHAQSIAGSTHVAQKLKRVRNIGV